MAQDIVGSKMPDFNKYGQNANGHASSDLPGEKTTSGMLPQCDLAEGEAANKQMRDVGASNVPDAHGMKRQTKAGI